MIGYFVNGPACHSLGSSRMVWLSQLWIALQADFATASASSQDSWLVIGLLTDGVIRIQQAVSILLGTGLGLALFAWGIWTTGVASKWLAFVGFGAAAVAGIVFPVANVVSPDGHAVAIAENGFVLGIVWDVWCGIVLIRTGAKATNVGAE